MLEEFYLQSLGVFQHDVPDTLVIPLNVGI